MKKRTRSAFFQTAWRSGVLCTALAAAILVAACRPDAGRLVLKERFAYPLADSGEIAGVVGGAMGQVLSWGPPRAQVLLTDAHGRRTLADSALTHPVGAAMLDAGEGAAAVEVFDGSSGRLIRFGPSATTAVRVTEGLQGTVASIHADSGWYAVLPERDSARGYAVRYLPDGDVRSRPVYRIGVPQGAYSIPARLSTWGTELVVTNPMRPYQTVVVHPTGGSRTLLLPNGIRQLENTRARWYSMPVQRVGSGFLQVFADLTSDDRLFVLYGDDGAVRRTSVVRAPLAIVAGHEEPSFLIGIRRTGRTELVGYTWEWKD